jgi:hypothetical protein
MEKTSLLAHIVHDYCSQAENIASNSLHFILEKSLTAKEAFYAYLKEYDINISLNAEIHNQIQDFDKNQPDLSITISKEPIVYIEAKFGAPLTVKQPVGYWQRLSGKYSSLLLFIVPECRLDGLWKELVDKLRVFEPDLVEQTNREVMSNHLPGKRMTITSWEQLLDVLLSAVEIKGEKDTASDIYQLKMMCQDNDIVEGEMEPSTGSYHQLVNSIDHWLKTDCKEFASKKGLTKGNGWDYYIQYISIHGIVCGIVYQPFWRRKYEDTSLWFWIGDSMISVRRLYLKKPHKEMDGSIIPLWVRGKEKSDETLDSLKDQILKIAQQLEPKRE